MEVFPKMHHAAATVRFLDRFGGLDRTGSPPIGSWSAEQNLSSRCYPALATRPGRTTVATLPNAGALIAKEHLWHVDGACLRHDDVSVDLGLTSGDKQLLSMGAYLLVWPDKKFLNTADLTDYGSMEQLNTAASVTVTPCRSDGRPLMAYSAADTPPASPVAGQHWLDTSTEPPLLKTYRSDTGAWEQTDTAAACITGAGIGHKLSAGDGVEIRGFANDALNGLFTLTATTEDSVVVPCALASAAGGTDITVSRTIPDMDFVTECGNRIWGCKYGTVDGAAVNEIYASKLGDFTNWRCFQGLATDSYAAARGSDGPWTAAVTYAGQPLFFKADCLDKVYPSPTGAHRIVSARCSGVAAGCGGSVWDLEGTLYYLSDVGVCAYSGAVPRVVSRDLGTSPLEGGVAGGWNGRYYLSARNGMAWELLTYDVKNALWHREDDLHAVSFAAWNGALYCLSAEGKLLQLDSGEGDAAMDWYAESGPLSPRSPRSQYVKQFVVRATTEGRVQLQLKYDDGPWESAGTHEGRGRSTFLLPVRQRRCDAIYVRLSGDRTCRVDAVSAYWEGGARP